MSDATPRERALVSVPMDRTNLALDFWRLTSPGDSGTVSTYSDTPANMTYFVVVYPFSADDAGSDTTAWARLERQETPSESLFDELAEKSPRRLVSMIRSEDLRPVDLFFAAKAAQHASPEIVEPVLLALLKHQSPIVREGAVYGLSRNTSPVVVRTLRYIAENDPSEGVRDAAEDFVESM